MTANFELEAQIVAFRKVAAYRQAAGDELGEMNALKQTLALAARRDPELLKRLDESRLFNCRVA
jgi:hypothetical protein